MNGKEKVIEIFRALGDSTRLSIITSLIDGEKTVTEIVESVGISQSAVSHQLRLLKAIDIVRCKRSGKNITYSISDNHISTILNQVYTHVAHGENK